MAYITNKVSTACYRKFLDHVVIAYQLEVLLGIDSFIPNRWKISSLAEIIQPALEQIDRGYKQQVAATSQSYLPFDRGYKQQVAATSQSYLPFNMKAIFEAADLDYSKLSHAKNKFVVDNLHRGTNLHIAIFLYAVLIVNFGTLLAIMFITF